MNSFNEYLNKKKELDEYSTSYQLDEGLWDNIKKGASNLKHNIGKEINAIGRANKVEGFSVTVDLNSNDLIKKIIKDAEKKASEGGDKPDYETEIKNYATKIAEGMYNAASGKVVHGKYGEANLYKDFQYITISGTKVAVVFKPSAKEGNPKKIIDAAAQDFVKILKQAICADVPRVPESAIKILPELVSKGYSKWMKQDKSDWADVKERLAPGIETLAEELSKNMDSIQKRLEKIAVQANRDNELGEDVKVYCIKWNINNTVLDNILYKNGKLKKTDTNPNEIGKAFSEYLNDQLVDLKYIKDDGSGKYELTKPDYSYCGLMTDPKNIRLYFRDKSEADIAYSDLANNLGNCSNVITVTRPEESIKKFMVTLPAEEFGKRRLYTETIKPAILSSINYVSVNVVFSNDQKKEFEQFLNADTNTVDESKIKDFLKKFIEIANKEIGNSFIGMGATATTLHAYCTSKEAAHELSSYYANHSLKATIGSCPVQLTEEAIGYITKIKNPDDFDKTEKFKGLIETIKKMVNDNICTTKDLTAIEITADDKFTKAMLKDTDFKGTHITETQLKSLITNKIGKIFDKLDDSNYSDAKDKLVGMSIINDKLVFYFNEDDSGSVNEFYQDTFVNPGFTVSAVKLAISTNAMKTYGKYKTKADAVKKFENAGTAFIESCLKTAENIANENAQHDVITVTLTDKFYQAKAEEIENSEDKTKQLDIIASALHNICKSEYNDCLTGIYINDNTINFILDPQAKKEAGDVFENKLKEVFNGAEFKTVKMVFANTHLELFKDVKTKLFYSKAGLPVKEIESIIKKLADICKVNRDAIVANNLKKVVFFAPIDNLADKEAVDGKEDPVKVVHTAIINVLNEVLKYTDTNTKDLSNSDAALKAKQNDEFVGYMILNHDGKNCIAFAFEQTAKDHLDIYKKFIAAQMHGNDKKIDVDESFTFAPKLLDYIIKDRKLPDENHIRHLLEDIKKITDANAKAAKDAAEQVGIVKVAFDNKIWASLIAGKSVDDFSDDDIAAKVVEKIVNVINKLKSNDKFIGVKPANANKLYFYFKPGAYNEEAQGEIEGFFNDVVSTTNSKGAVSADTGKLTTEGQETIKKALDSFTKDNISSILGKLSKLVQDQVDTNYTAAQWVVKMSFDGIKDKSLVDLTTFNNTTASADGWNLTIVDLKHTISASFVNALNKYLLNMINEAKGVTNIITPKTKSLPSEIKAYLNSDEGKNAFKEKTNDAKEATKISKAPDIVPLFLNYWASSIKSNSVVFARNTTKEKLNISVDGTTMTFAFNGAKENVAEFLNQLAGYKKSSYGLITSVECIKAENENLKNKANDILKR